MTGELKEDDSISSLNQDIKKEQEKLEKGESPGNVDIQQFIGTTGEPTPDVAFFINPKPQTISAHQAGMLVEALQWTLGKVRKNWDDLDWEDAAIVTVMENQLMNIRLQQKQIGKGEKDVNSGKNGSEGGLE